MQICSVQDPQHDIICCEIHSVREEETPETQGAENTSRAGRGKLSWVPTKPFFPSTFNSWSLEVDERKVWIVPKSLLSGFCLIIWGIGKQWDLGQDQEHILSAFSPSGITLEKADEREEKNLSEPWQGICKCSFFLLLLNFIFNLLHMEGEETEAVEFTENHSWRALWHFCLFPCYWKRYKELVGDWKKKPRLVKALYV